MGQELSCVACVPNAYDSDDTGESKETQKSHVIESAHQTFKRAVNSQNESLIRKLIDDDDSLLDITFPDGNNALHIAVKQQDQNLVRYFLSEGLSPNKQNCHNGDTSLHIASRLRNAEIVELLTKYDADQTISNYSNETPLSIVTNHLNDYQKIANTLNTIDEDTKLSDTDPNGSDTEVKSKISAAEVATHNSLETGIWIIIGGSVYDITLFIKDKLHPATNAFIEPYFGKDATEPFDANFHSAEAVRLLKKYEIGELAGHKAQFPLHRAISLRKGFDEDDARSSIQVSALYLYPVKGMKGFEVQTAALSLSGFANDRLYAVVNKANMKVINQLTYPQLSLITVAFPDGSNTCDEGIQLNDKLVPFIKEKTSYVTWKSCTTKILVYDQGEEIAQWITSFLNVGHNENEDEFIFVRIHEENYRETEEFFALSFADKETQKISAFQNYAPALLASEESLQELNRRYKEKEHSQDDEKEITWDRFRMNIIIKGVQMPNYEDFMKHITFGDKSQKTERAEILWTRRRYFCAVPQVNQKTGKNTQEPKSTARRYRNAITLNDRTSLPKDDAVFFGCLYCVKHSGVISVGQSVVSEHERLEYDTIRTAFGKSWFGLTEDNLGSQFEINYLKQYEDFKLVSKEKYNHDTIKIRFKMVIKAHHKFRISLEEALRMGDHYLLKFLDVNQSPIIRAYTPLFDHLDDDSSDDMSFDLLVKVYPNGKMTQHLNKMKIGDSILCKKKSGKVCYFEVGKIRFGDPRLTMFAPYVLNVNKMNLIAAGSGITPIYQIIKSIDLNKEFDLTQISVIYANKNIEDILLKDKLEDVLKTNPKIKIHFVIENEAQQNEMSKHIDTGRITVDMCKKHLFPPNEKDDEIDVITMLCGPAPMLQAVKLFLSQMGFDEKSISAF